MQALSMSLSLPIRPAARCTAPHAPQHVGRRRAAVPRASDKPSGAEQAIEGLSSAYCDEFVCTSSPAVEASVRQLARDLQRANGKWAPIYTRDVEYSDTFRKFKGAAGFQRHDFVASSVGKPAVSITGMRMLSNSAAQITWRLTGSLGPLPIDVAGTTDISMNLLTGRIERQSERWDLSRCSPPAAVAWTAARALWAAKRGSSDAGDAANSMLDTLSLDDDDSFQQPNSNDPLKFFQQKDTFKQDAVFFCGVLLLFYTLVQAWTGLFSGSSGLSGF